MRELRPHRGERERERERQRNELRYTKPYDTTLRAPKQWLASVYPR